MAGEFAAAVVFEVLLDDIYAFHFIEEEEEDDDDLPMHVFYGNINCPGKFESVSWVFRTNSTLPLMNFKATSVRKDDSGHGRQLPVGNPFGRQVIGARKQVSIFLWYIANEEKTRLTLPIPSVSPESSLPRYGKCSGLRNQYI